MVWSAELSVVLNSLSNSTASNWFSGINHVTQTFHVITPPSRSILALRSQLGPKQFFYSFVSIFSQHLKPNLKLRVKNDFKPHVQKGAGTTVYTYSCI